MTKVIGNYRTNIEELKINLGTLHSNKFKYDWDTFKGMKYRMKIICPIHGEFFQTPENHKKGCGCWLCRNENISRSKTKSIYSFIEDATNLYGKTYDYSNVIYKNTHEKVMIVCPIHGIFYQTPSGHLSGRGCRKCGSVNSAKAKYHDTNIFMEQIKKINFNKNYDYSEIKYVDSWTKVKIICHEKDKNNKDHGEFYITPVRLIHENGHCPKCSETTGEKNVRNILEQQHISFEFQKTFSDCINIKKLPFDFYIPEYNLCIEYDGPQHYDREYCQRRKWNFENIQKRDNIKNKYCLMNNISLLRLPHYLSEKEIEYKIQEQFNLFLKDCYV